MSKLNGEYQYLNYRPDIDGLRAIAVLAVIGFHGFGIKSGFIGVDIFFVISGFLITKILLHEIQNNSFSILSFYGRRIRRIFPSLILVLITTLALGWLFLFPNEFELLGKHTWGGAAFLSNYISLQESGYFQLDAEKKPLLHLWSLAIEEQFYLLWPLMMWLVLRTNISFFYLVSCIFLISFYFNVSHLAHSEQLSFFSPQSRFWELGVGAFVAYLSIIQAPYLRNIRPPALNLIASIGYILVIIGFTFINKYVSFPGYWALFPVIGTGCIIFSGPNALLNKVLLSNKYLVGIGLISFPLYLWHWPLLVFPQILNIDFKGYWKLIFISCTFLLSWLTFKIVEKNLRRSKEFFRVSIALLLCMIAIFFLGLSIHKNLIPAKLNDLEISEASRAVSDWDYPANLDIAENYGYKFNILKASSEITLMIGDSHLEHYSTRFLYLKQGKADINSVIWGARGGCLPIPQVFQDSDKICPEMRKATLMLLERRDVTRVVVGACWSCYFNDANSNLGKSIYYFANGNQKYALGTVQGRGLALENLSSFLKELKKTKDVYLLLGSPLSQHANPHLFLNEKRFGRSLALKPDNFIINMTQSELILRNDLLDLAKKSEVKVIDPIQHLCVNNICNGLSVDNQFIYKDESHLRPFFVKKNATYMDVAVSKM